MNGGREVNRGGRGWIKVEIATMAMEVLSPVDGLTDQTGLF